MKPIKPLNHTGDKEFTEGATEAISGFIRETLSEKGSCVVALSGGNSPKKVYERLAGEKGIDWGKVEIFQADERSDHSNAQMIRSVLTDRLPNLKAFHEMSDDYEKRLGEIPFPMFDLVILGLGEDGHTASLFPGIPELEELNKIIVQTSSPAGIKDRLTLTFPALLSSRKIIFLIRGGNKKGIMEKWLADNRIPVSELPAKRILEHGNVEVYTGF